jgi:hypothetical protein
MLAELRQQYDTLEEVRRELIRTVCGLDSGKLRHKPEPERWSILEDFQHLVLAEQRTVLAFESIPASEARKPEMLEMVLQVLDQDIAVDVPDPAMLPDGQALLEDLIFDWEQARQRLEGFLEACGPDDLQAPVSHHPVTGPLTVVDGLRLIASHFHHHRRRIEAAMDKR